MSMQAVAIMLKAMGLNIDPIAEKVNELVADGTIDRAAAVLKVMSQNGTFEQLVTFAAKLDEHNRLLSRIVELMEEANGYEPAETGTVVRTDLPLGFDPGAERRNSFVGTSDNGAGMPGAAGPD